LLEVVIYREMCRRGYEVTIGRVKEKEVDFVCKKGADRLYVQVAYLMPTQETREREFGALMSVPDQYDKLVLSMDRFDFSAEGIRHRYLPEFLAESANRLNCSKPALASKSWGPSPRCPNDGSCASRRGTARASC